VSAVAVARLRPRNATESAILEAARGALTEDGWEHLTMNDLAQRAYVSRTNVYFYFANKRAVLDRLVQSSFAEMLVAAEPYLEGEGDPRRELSTALTQIVTIVNRDASVLLLAGAVSGAEDRLPPEWEPYIRRFVRGAERRIRNDQQRGVAPGDIDAGLAAHALCAMIERHITVHVIKGGQPITESIRTLSELWWRAVYLFPPE
jgi:AcrR family transcriptional regulator